MALAAIRIAALPSQTTSWVLRPADDGKAFSRNWLLDAAFTATPTARPEWDSGMALAANVVAVLLVTFASAAVDGVRAQSPPDRLPESALDSGSTDSAVEGEREIRGVVISTMNATGYTYVEIDAETGSLWAAAPRTNVSVGDEVLLTTAVPMYDFYSPSLARRFDRLYLASSLRTMGKSATPVDLPLRCSQPGGDADQGGSSTIEARTDALTIREIINDKSRLAGKRVRVRGKVVDFSAGDLGRNSFEIRDGSLPAGAMTGISVATRQTVQEGCNVLVQGTVATRPAPGNDEKHDMLIEDATITLE